VGSDVRGGIDLSLGIYDGGGVDGHESCFSNRKIVAYSTEKTMPSNERMTSSRGGTVGRFPAARPAA
jgi:argonaute-like protein implicated in RNA metabolism and viral defense